MSRLVNPGVGEICDRLTILELKILTGLERGADIDHWGTERTQLLNKIHARTLNAAWFDGVLTLAGINALIWHAEDDLRDYRGSGSGDLLYTSAQLEQIRILAFRLQALNDQRADLVHRINTEAGDGSAKDK